MEYIGRRSPEGREFFGSVDENEIVVCIRSRKLASSIAMAHGYYYDTSCTRYPNRKIGKYAEMHKLPMGYFRSVYGRDDYDEDYVKITRDVWNLYLSGLFLEFLNEELEEYQLEMDYQASGNARLPPFYASSNVFFEKEN